MFKSWGIKDLNLSRAFDVVPDINPERSLRYSIPVPNWLNEAGIPVISHAAIRNHKEGGNDWRFIFWNFKDECDQTLRIDGSSSVMFAGISPAKAQKLTDFIESIVEDIDSMTPDQLTFILDYAKEGLGLGDRYTKKQHDLHNEMDSWITLHGEKLGAFLPKMNISSCIYVPGNGEFVDGPAATPQRFENGAFVVFPGHASGELIGLDASSLKALKPKIVQTDVFMGTRTHVNGDAITFKDCQAGYPIPALVPENIILNNEEHRPY